MYLGALLGFVFQIPLGRKGGLPSLKIKIILGALFVAFGIDGMNSYLHFFPAVPTLYQPQNWLRLLTGTGVGLAGVIDALMLSKNPLILYPLALLSSGTILLILSLIYTIIWGYLIKKENQFHSWKQMAFLLLAGFTTALLQIAAMDAVRYALTGTWAGFFQG